MFYGLRVCVLVLFRDKAARARVEDAAGFSYGFETVVKYIPMRLIVTETDSSNPWEVVNACEIIAHIKGLTSEEVGFNGD